MATTQTATVTLTREHRDAIRDEARRVVSSAGDIHLYFERVAESQREWFRTIAWRLTVCARLLDQMGWQEHGDRDSYRVAVDADIARFMADLGRDARAVLKDRKGGLFAPREAYAGYEMTDEEWERHRAAVRGLVDIELDSIDAAQIVQTAFEGTVA